MGLNLGQDWEFQPDAPNNRLYAEYGPNGSQFSFDESGDLTLDSGSLDLSGGSLTDSTRGYVDLTGDDNDLRLAIGQSIQDTTPARRLTFESNQTVLDGPSNVNSDIHVQNVGSSTRDGIEIRIKDSTETWDIYDEVGTFEAVRYTPSSSEPGQLELTSANLDVNGNDITNVGSVNAEQSNITELAGKVFNDTRFDIPHNTLTQMNFDTVVYEDSEIIDIDTTNNNITILEPGKYEIIAICGYRDLVDAGVISLIDGNPDNQRNTKTEQNGIVSFEITLQDQFDANDVITVDMRQDDGSGNEETRQANDRIENTNVTIK